MIHQSSETKDIKLENIDASFGCDAQPSPGARIEVAESLQDSAKNLAGLIPAALPTDDGAWFAAFHGLIGDAIQKKMKLQEEKHAAQYLECYQMQLNDKTKKWNLIETGLKVENEELKEKVENLEKNLDGLKKEIEEKQQEIQNKDLEIGNQRATIMEKNQTIELQENHNNALRQAEIRLESEKENLTEEFQGKEAAWNSEKHQILEQHTKELQRAIDENQKLLEEKEALEKKLVDDKKLWETNQAAEIEKLNSTWKEKLEIISKAFSDKKKDLATQIVRISEERSRAEGRVELKREEIGKLEAKLVQMTGAAVQNECDLERLQNELDELKRTHATLTTAHKTEVERLEEKIKEQKTSIGTLTGKVENLEVEKAELENQVTDNESYLGDLAKSIQGKRDNIHKRRSLVSTNSVLESPQDRAAEHGTPDSDDSSPKGDLKIRIRVPEKSKKRKLEVTEDEEKKKIRQKRR